MDRKVAVIGECMIEIQPGSDGGKYVNPTMNAVIRYGGDTLNCSIYMARLGVLVDYVTVLGDDPLSDWMLKQWRAEGIGCALVSREPNSVPGLYLIDIDADGERSFYYWREQAPARRLFDDKEKAQRLFTELRRYEYLYLSGITLALYAKPVRERLFAFLDEYRSAGGQVLFDNNYRPRQWRDRDQAMEAFEQMYRRTDIALPTIDDEILLFGSASQSDIIARLESWGVTEIVLKKGAEGCLTAVDSIVEEVAAVPIDVVVDTTAAGDSFNAGFLAARLGGQSSKQAAGRGNQLAALVVQHPGAIVGKELMMEMLRS